MWQNIVQSFRRELRDLSDTFSFAPDWAIWAALLVGVFVLACLVHGGLLALAHRVFRQRRPYLNRVLEATKNPIRLRLLLTALAMSLPAESLHSDECFILV